MIEHRRTFTVRRRRGFALIMTCAMALSMLGFAGLAIDVSSAYAIKAKLQKAVDSAAIAGASSLSAGLNATEQTASAQAAANKYFYANYPNNAFGATEINLTTTVAVQTNSRRVEVVATLNAPTYFMRMFNFNSLPARAVGEATRRDANVILVLDRSGSMCQGAARPCTVNACAVMKAAAQTFVEKFSPGRDRLGLVTFGGTVWAQGPTDNFDSYITDIGNIQCSGATNSATALQLAANMLQGLNLPGALNTIVFFTDGQPTAFNGVFPMRAGNTCGAGVTSIPDPDVPQIGFITVGTSSGTPDGWTGGVFRANATSITDTSEVRLDNAIYNNCQFRTDSWQQWAITEDIGALPAQDIYGNRLSGSDLYKGTLTLALNSSNSNNAANFNMTINASYNAADDAALRARTHATIPATIYAIGLGGMPTLAADSTWLARVANDPNGPTLYGSTYNASQPSGYYVYSPDNDGLAAAFNLVASQILRLSK